MHIVGKPIIVKYSISAQWTEILSEVAKYVYSIVATHYISYSNVTA